MEMKINMSKYFDGCFCEEVINTVNYNFKIFKRYNSQIQKDQNEVETQQSKLQVVDDFRRPIKLMFLLSSLSLLRLVSCQQQYSSDPEKGLVLLQIDKVKFSGWVEQRASFLGHYILLVDWQTGIQIILVSRNEQSCTNFWTNLICTLHAYHTNRTSSSHRFAVVWCRLFDVALPTQVTTRTKMCSWRNCKVFRGLSASH